MEVNKLYNKLLISKIRLKRLELGITQAQLAKKINISPITFSHIESGRREIKVLETVKLCKYLNIRIGELSEICLKELNSNLKLDPSSKKTLKNRIVTFTSFKGGVGVSTISTILANEIAKDYKILFIDSHYQNSCYDNRLLDLEVSPDIKPLYEIVNIDIKELQSYIEKNKTNYDYVIIDLPRFFYIPEYIDEITNQSDYLFAPFIPQNNAKKASHDIPNFLKYTAQGRLDLFVEYREYFKGRDITFCLIPFMEEVKNELLEQICYDKNIILLSETFKRYSEHELFYNTLMPISSLDNAFYNPFIIDSLKVIYHIKKIIEADLVLEDLIQLNKQKWNIVMTKAN